MNFFNMVTAHTPSEKKIVVTLGCVEKKYEILFEETLQNAGIAMDKVYFLPLETSQQCLILRAGISCRVKTIPIQSD